MWLAKPFSGIQFLNITISDCHATWRAKVNYILLSINSLTLIRFQVHVSLILTKESPFLEPLIMQLKRMEQSGVLENIRKRYYPSTVNDCKESKVALGYNQLWFPIIILFLGTFLVLFWDVAKLDTRRYIKIKEVVESQILEGLRFSKGAKIQI